MRERIANLTSKILNPLVVSLVLILLLSLKSTFSTLDAVKWSLISIAISILPVFLAIIYLVHKQRLESLFVITRRQRTRIYLLAVVCAGVGSIVLFYFGAPKELLVTFVAAFSAVAIFMCVNLLWKISLHTAITTASVAVLIILYGSTAVAIVALVPLIIWSRIELEHHSLAQSVAGALLAALIVVIVFYLFGLVAQG